LIAEVGNFGEVWNFGTRLSVAAAMGTPAQVTVSRLPIATSQPDTRWFAPYGNIIERDGKCQVFRNSKPRRNSQPRRSTSGDRKPAKFDPFIRRGRNSSAPQFVP
jgi:hypothetical protein